MTHRLVWNFEFTHARYLNLAYLHETPEEDLKWEARFFWPKEEIIGLALVDNSLLELGNYQHKQKKDYYFLLPQESYNIKSRRDEIWYKPLVKKTKYASGFGMKLNLSELSANKTPPEEYGINALKLMEQLDLQSTKVLVKKESLTYKFALEPAIRLELSRIEINQRIYFSVCVEGRSQELVEMISHHLLGGKQSSCDYLGFLKKVIKKR